MRAGEWLVTLALLLCAAVLGYALYQEIDDPPAAQPAATTLRQPRDRASPSAMQPILQRMPALTIEELGETLARPLFSPTRRPPTADAEPGEDTAAQISVPVGKSEFTVMGIMLTSDTRSALLKLRGNGKETVHAVEGQSIPGSDWKVVEITPGWVRIERHGTGETLKLSDNVLSAAEKRRLLQQSRQLRRRAPPPTADPRNKTRTATERRLPVPATPPRRLPLQTLSRPAVRAPAR